MKYTGKPVVDDYGELAQALDAFSARAATADGAELVALWPKLERRVLARVRADELDAITLGGAPATEEERIRNLAWEVGVSVDLQVVHVRALTTLVRLIRERAERGPKHPPHPRRYGPPRPFTRSGSEDRASTR